MLVIPVDRDGPPPHPTSLRSVTFPSRGRLLGRVNEWLPLEGKLSAARLTDEVSFYDPPILDIHLTLVSPSIVLRSKNAKEARLYEAPPSGRPCFLQGKLLLFARIRMFRVTRICKRLAKSAAGGILIRLVILRDAPGRPGRKSKSLKKEVKTA